MFARYMTLLRQSFINGFKGQEYRRWWRVPVNERLKIAMPTGILAGVVTFVLLSLPVITPVAWLCLLIFWLLIVAPVLEHYTEQLKQKYDK